MTVIRNFFASLLIGALGATAMPALAQSSDISPTLLIEVGPSDKPDYRRMIFTKYLSGDRVSVNYKSYNRAEFIQMRPDTPIDVIKACSRGAASSLSDLRAYERNEAKLAKRGEKPEIARFCIKNVRGWESSDNRKRYLDHIFNGLPPAASWK